MDSFMKLVGTLDEARIKLIGTSALDLSPRQGALLNNADVSSKHRSCSSAPFANFSKGEN